jgi:tetratricopeptide (TPR) repeat protein
MSHSSQVLAGHPRFFCLLLNFLLVPAAMPQVVACQERHAPLTAAGKEALIDSIATLVEYRFVLADQARAFADSLRSRCASGSYDDLSTPAAFAEAVTADLREITSDSHFLMRVIEPSDVGEQAQSALHHPVRLFRLSQREHLGFARLEWLEGNIGYLDLRRFYPISESKEMADGAMRFLSGADAVIIDLRENGGGAGESLPYFTRYFLPYHTQLTSYYSRESDFLTEFWTVREVGGPLLSDVPLFLLTSERTFSAAEMFAYDMKVRGRATLVGSVTAGGAHSVDLFQLDERFEIYISTARAINPVTNGNWEGVGVIPDVVVSADVALDTALVLARSAGQEYREPKDAELACAVQRMERALARVEEAFRDGRDADGALALDDLLAAGADQGLVNEFFLSVLAYNYGADADQALLLAILWKRVELFPQSVEAHEALATALANIGEDELARMYFLRALELDPDNSNVKKKLDRLGNR